MLDVTDRSCSPEDAMLLSFFRVLSSLLLALISGCSTSSSSSPEELCGARESRLRACGVTSEDATLPCLSHPTHRCELRCERDASCEDLATRYCNAGAYAGTALSSCVNGCGFVTFLCPDGSELAANQVCNGSADCSDGSDEQYCSTFSCASGEMLSTIFLCNDEWDCSDGSDEGAAQCGAFTCASGLVISMMQRCDGAFDCDDASDEADCPRTLHAQLTCS